MEPNQVLDILNSKAKPPADMEKMLKRWRSVYYGISLHTSGACPAFKDPSGGGMIKPAAYFCDEHQTLFDKYLLNRHPRESETTRNWRYSQYRPMTKAPFAQITEIITGAIFQDGNYSIEITNEKDKEYIWGNNFSGNHLTGYYSTVGFRHMIEDPNGVFIRIPKKPYDEQDGKGVEVDIWFVSTCDIKYFSSDAIIFLRDGYAWYVDKAVIFRFAKKSEKQYELKPEDANGYYAHMMGRLPLNVAGGDWNTYGYYDSFYDKAKAAADDFIACYSAAQLVDKEAAHPFIIEASEDCIECQGVGKVQYDCETCPNGMELRTCQSCNGAKTQASDPAKRLIVPYEKMKDGQLVQIITPDVSANKHLADKSKDVMLLIIEALHLKKTDKAESGEAKAIDQERLYQFVSKISNHVFDTLIYDSLRDLIAYRNVTTVDGLLTPAIYDFKVVKPAQFQIKTAADLLEEYNDAGKANVPKFVLAKHALDYVEKQYSGDDVLKKKTEMVIALDWLAMYTAQDITMLKLNNDVTQDEVTLHNRLPSVIDEIIRDKGAEWFIMATYEQVKSEVDPKILALVPKLNELQKQAMNNMQQA